MIRPALLAVACAPIGVTGYAYAQPAYPVKPITLLIPFPPGTGNDIVGRVVGGKMGEYLGQRMVPDNRSGASGSIAMDATRRAAPDGYTVVVASTSFAIGLYAQKVPYGLHDFTPVALIGKAPYTLMLAKSLPAKDMKELVVYIRTKPGQLNAGQGGPTGTTFFLTEMLKKAAGADILSVPYKGTTDGVADLLAERTQLMFAPIVTSLPHYRAGKVQVHGITGAARSALMPNVPTFTESGYPRLDIPTWFALLGPAGMPRNAVTVLSENVAKALASKDVTDPLANQGVESSYAGPAELDAFLKADTAMWRTLVKEAGITPQ